MSGYNEKSIRDFHFVCRYIDENDVIFWKISEQAHLSPWRDSWNAG